MLGKRRVQTKCNVDLSKEDSNNTRDDADSFK